MLLTREQFKEQVFKRDNYACVVCKNAAVDAHHIIERKLWEDGGYYLSNGVALCEYCHYKAEQTLISCQTLREKAGIEIPIYPNDLVTEGWNVCIDYDKWGNPIMVDGTRKPGKMFETEQVQKILKEAGLMDLFNNQKYYKYGRTPHLPWSEKATDDDKRLSDVDHFIGKRVIVSVKLDGENTSIYNDKTHARSINSDNHPSRDWLKGFWSTFNYEIPDDFRICGENMYALHTIPYENLDSYFFAFSVWIKEKCLSWDETLEWCELLGLKTVPVLYDGIFDENLIKSLYKPTYNGNPMEGYVVRLYDSFFYYNFEKSIAKYVSNSFVIDSNKHWMQGKVIPNKLKNEKK